MAGITTPIEVRVDVDMEALERRINELTELKIGQRVHIKGTYENRLDGVYFITAIRPGCVEVEEECVHGPKGSIGTGMSYDLRASYAAVAKDPDPIDHLADADRYYAGIMVQPSIPLMEALVAQSLGAAMHDGASDLPDDGDDDYIYTSGAGMIPTDGYYEKPKPAPYQFAAKALKSAGDRYLYPQTLVGGEYGKFTYEKDPNGTHAVWTFETESGRDKFVKHYAKSLEAAPI